MVAKALLCCSSGSKMKVGIVCFMLLRVADSHRCNRKSTVEQQTWRRKQLENKNNNKKKKQHDNVVVSNFFYNFIYYCIFCASKLSLQLCNKKTVNWLLFFIFIFCSF